MAAFNLVDLLGLSPRKGGEAGSECNLEVPALRGTAKIVSGVLRHTTWTAAQRPQQQRRGTASAAPVTSHQSTAGEVGQHAAAADVINASISSYFADRKSTSVGCQCGASEWQITREGGTDPASVFITEDLLRSSYRMKDEALVDDIRRRVAAMTSDFDQRQQAHEAEMEDMRRRLEAAEECTREAAAKHAADQESFAAQKRRVLEEKQALVDEHRALELRCEDLSHQLAHARRQQATSEQTIKKLEDNINAAVTRELQHKYAAMRSGGGGGEGSPNSRLSTLAPGQVLSPNMPATERLQELQRRREELLHMSNTIGLDPLTLLSPRTAVAGVAATDAGSGEQRAASPRALVTGKAQPSTSSPTAASKVRVAVKVAQSLARFASPSSSSQQHGGSPSARSRAAENETRRDSVSSAQSAHTTTSTASSPTLGGRASSRGSLGGFETVTSVTLDDHSPTTPRIPAARNRPQHVVTSPVSPLRSPTAVAARRRTVFAPPAAVAPRGGSGGGRPTGTGARRPTVAGSSAAYSAASTSLQRVTSSMASLKRNHRSSVSFGDFTRATDTNDRRGSDAGSVLSEGLPRRVSTASLHHPLSEERGGPGQLEIMAAAVAMLPQDELATMLAQQQLAAQTRLLALADRLQATVAEFERRSGPAQLATVEGQVSAALTELRELYESQLAQIRETARTREETLNHRWAAAVRHAEVQVNDKAKIIGELVDKVAAADAKVRAAEAAKVDAEQQSLVLLGRIKQLHKTLLVQGDAPSSAAPVGGAAQPDTGSAAQGGGAPKVCAMCRERVVHDAVDLQHRYRGLGAAVPSTQQHGATPVPNESSPRDIILRRQHHSRVHASTWTVDDITGGLKFNPPPAEHPSSDVTASQVRHVTPCTAASAAASLLTARRRPMSASAIAPCRDHLMYDARKAAQGAAPYPLDTIAASTQNGGCDLVVRPQASWSSGGGSPRAVAPSSVEALEVHATRAVPVPRPPPPTSGASTQPVGKRSMPLVSGGYAIASTWGGVRLDQEQQDPAHSADGGSVSGWSPAPPP